MTSSPAATASRVRFERLRDRHAAKVEVVGEAREVALFMLAPKPHQRVRERAGRRLLNALLTQPDAKSTLRGAVVAIEVRGY